MLRWIVFDHDTEKAVLGRLQADRVEIQEGDALSAALKSHEDCVVILPSNQPRRALLVHIRPMPATEREVPVEISVNQAPAFVPTGFLGLSDAPAFFDNEEEKPGKRHWWQWRKAG